MKRFSGVNPLLFTPFTATEEVDENSLRREIDHVINAGVNSVVAMGRAGEFEYLTMEERRRIIDVVVDHVAGRVPVGFGAINPSVEEGLIMGRWTREAGGDFVMSSPPHDGDIQDYYPRLADEVPILLYDHGYEGQLVGKVPIELIVPLVQTIENVVALKISGQPDKVLEAKKKLDIPVLQSWHEGVLLAYEMGCDGTITASSSLIPHLEIRLHGLAQEERWDEARDLFYEKFAPLLLLYLGGGPGFRGWSTAKHFLYWQGVFDTPVVRPPSLDASGTRLEEARHVFQRIGLVAKVAAQTH